MADFDCWQSGNHVDLFDSKVYYPFFCLKNVYHNFNEFRLLNRFVSKDEKIALMEVGCATGELYRYFKHNYPNINYIGIDVSKLAVERAKVKYPEGNFLCVDSELLQVKDASVDYLFSRDVVLHQKDPFGFLLRLCSIAKRGLILRLRTRDHGLTELDIDKSCQYYLGTWIPYMVLNCDELISCLKASNRCSKILFLKHYILLGGVNSRYLPKDCYLESTGTAETVLCLELGKDGKNSEIKTSVAKERYSVSKLDRILYKIIQYGLRPKATSRVWW